MSRRPNNHGRYTRGFVPSEPDKVSLTFTTGQIAKLFRVAPRTVSKWFDSGRMKGYRIPGSNDRRVPIECLRQFCKDHDLPVPPILKDGIVAAYGVDGEIPDGVAFGEDPFAFGAIVNTNRNITAVVVGMANGHAEAVGAVRIVLDILPGCLVYVLPSDDTDLTRFPESVRVIRGPIYWADLESCVVRDEPAKVA